MTRFRKDYVALPEHIDELGHVNNAVWIQWAQDIAVSHWHEVADQANRDAFIWVVVRHEIDYRGNIDAGQVAKGETWIQGAARGATSLRRVEFTDATGRPIVSAATTWAMLNRASGRPARVPAELLAPFRSDD